MTLRYETQGPVAVVTLNRPDARNALNNDLRAAIRDAMARAEQDDAVGAVVLTGADPAFCAGMDLKELGQQGLMAPERKVFYDWWDTMTTPVIGAVNGVAITGGLEVALACDILIASERARFGDTHARVGIMPGGGLTTRLPRAVGLRKAKEMSFTGNFLTAEEALAFGMVTHVVAHEELLPTALRLANDIAANDVESVRALNQLYNDVEALPAGEGRELEKQRSRAWATSRDTATGVESRREAVMARGRTMKA